MKYIFIHTKNFCSSDTSAYFLYANNVTTYIARHSMLMSMLITYHTAGYFDSAGSLIHPQVFVRIIFVMWVIKATMLICWIIFLSDLVSSLTASDES